MTLDQIETFLAVADCGSFKAASEQLHRSQPALSVAVKKLEEELEINLFNREEYRPTLSPHGKAFYAKAKEFFSQSQGLQKYARQLSMGEEPEISLAIESLCPLSLVMDSLKAFSAIHPDTRLNISFEVLGGAAEKLEKGEVQLAISPAIGRFTEGFECEPLVNVFMIPVMSKTSPILKSGKKVTLDDLKSFPQIIVQDSGQNPTAQHFGVLEGARRWYVKDVDTKAKIIINGLGWGRLPAHKVEKELACGDLVELTTNPLNREEIPVWLMASSVYPMGPLTQKMRDFFLDNASKMRDYPAI